jgi:hypothetical protein|tara:strand:+ start:4083 stop:4346 length:264 start_codon:yes stop_codon:yes gene_type:complete
MPRPRALQAAEAPLWVAVLLDYAFSEKSAERAAQLDLLGVAHDVTAYPNDMTEARLAELLLIWSKKHVPTEDWKRLQGRVRKRRSPA